MKQSPTRILPSSSKKNSYGIEKTNIDMSEINFELPTKLAENEIQDGRRRVLSSEITSVDRVFNETILS